jgi:hypothetical protein
MSHSKRSDRAAACLALWMLVPQAVPAQQGVLGYDDTPMQPNGKWRVHDIRRPHPPIVSPGPPGDARTAPPSDAIVLLGLRDDLSAWQTGEGAPAAWPLKDGILQVGKGTIQTKREFADFQLHVEFATPDAVAGHSQGRGNSGVFLLGRFEVQILDSYDNPTYADGQAAALYGQHPPLVNASRPPGEWQAFDIIFAAPRFGADGRLEQPAVVTVLHNGVLVHHAAALWGPTRHRSVLPYAAEMRRGPIALQDHGNPVRYRNIWIRPLDERGRPQ